MTELKPSVVLKNYFGLLEGTTIKDFLAELKSLSDDEKRQLAEGIVNETYTYS